MVKANYSPAFAAVITSCAAIITALIPPSIGLIIYGYIADVSVGRLFIGGIIPGLLLAASLMIVTWIIAKKRGYKPLRTEFAGMPELGRVVPRCALGALDPGVHHRRHPLRHLHADRGRRDHRALHDPGRRLRLPRACRICRPAEGAEGDRARHQLGDADDLRRLGLRLLPRLGADPAADGGLAGVADQGSGRAAAADQRPADRPRHRRRRHVGADHPDADLRADPGQAATSTRCTSASSWSPT